MSSNAMAEAKKLAHDAAMTTSVRIDLATLQALILELEQTHAEAWALEQQVASFRQQLNVADDFIPANVTKLTKPGGSLGET